MKKILVFLATILVAVVPLVASSQTTTPTVTTSATGVCGIAMNTCAAGTLGDNAPQYDPKTGVLTSYQWYCSGVNGGATSPLCFTATVTPPPPPPATDLLDTWVLDVEVGNIVDGINGSTRDFPQGDLPLQFTLKTGTSYPESQSYEGKIDGDENSSVYLYYYMPMNGGQRTVEVSINYSTPARFGESATSRWIDARVTLPDGNYGWGVMVGEIRKLSSGQVVDQYVTGVVRIYRKDCCKGDAGGDAGK